MRRHSFRSKAKTHPDTRFTIGAFIIAWLLLLLIYSASCSDHSPTAPQNVDNVTMNMIPLSDTIYQILVAWPNVSDRYGDVESYIHTATSSIPLPDDLPNERPMMGTRDSYTITVSLIKDTVSITSSIWSVRRGIRSTTPAVGTLFIRRGDQAPPPPDSIVIDTISLPPYLQVIRNGR